MSQGGRSSRWLLGGARGDSDSMMRAPHAGASDGDACKREAVIVKQRRAGVAVKGTAIVASETHLDNKLPS